MVNQNRNFGLDFIRATAILLVLADHSKFFFTSLHPAFNSLSICSFYGVELFFVLSGYLIGGSLFRSYFSSDGINRKVAVNFWKRRWLRTLPNYFLVLLILMIFFPLPSSGIMNYFFFLQNFNSSIPSFYQVSWSLTIEEWFYLMLPLLLMLSGKLKVADTSKARAALLVLLSFLFLFILIRAFGKPDRFDWNTGIRQILIYRLDAALYGVLLALGYHHFTAFFQKFKNILLALSGSLLILSTIIYYQIENPEIPDWTVTNLLFVITNLACALILPFFIQIKAISIKPVQNLVTGISLISYSLYLLNYDLVLRPVSRYYDSGGISGSILYFFIYLSISFILASLMYRFFEKPILLYRDKTIPKRT